MAKTMVGLSDEMTKNVDHYAKKHGVDRTEAVDRMLSVSVSRLNALSRYAAKGGAAKPAKKVAKKAAKKAQGPIARKAKAAA